MFAGIVEGIASNDKFYLYQYAPLLGQDNAKGPFAKMIATRVGHTSTVLQHLAGAKNVDKFPRTFYAKRIDSWNTPIIISCEDRGLRTGVMQDTDLAVDDPSEALIVISVEGDDVYLESNDPLINAYVPSLRRLPCKLQRNEPNTIKRVISSWRHFDYHLRREPADEYKFPQIQQIRMELHYLEGVGGQTNEPNVEHVPIGLDLLATDPARVLVSDEHKYRPLGFTLYNDSDTDVYPYLFYFDPTKLTISKSIFMHRPRSTLEHVL
jgi:hypothetical protein